MNQENGAPAPEQPSQNSSSEIGGGHGTVTAWSQPLLVLDSAGDIVSTTPCSHIAAAGATYCAVAGQDMHLLAQANFAIAAMAGLCIATVGKATNPDKPNQETGISMHAASGNVSVQSQTGATNFTADKNIEISSTTRTVRVAAAKRVLLAAGGAAITLEEGGISLNGNQVLLKAGQKVFAGPSSATAEFQRHAKPGDIAFDDRLVVTTRAGGPMANMRYEITRADGTVLSGTTNAQGQIEQQHSFKGEPIVLKVMGGAA